ncbi:lytic transglycosylase domain-containing protein (plasmid) [Xanthomonas citri pv. citri]|nr:lytic transglycosylase domain-containing protein [Xanthomonas citri pv. citri]QRD67032.1 lytic transglycosylase domain-containing protein [Xanthomonas citri pv. citri]QRD71715.1 lytic transglycosylase domain-containing protein [Xanthomonas citri pv. citri]
MGALSGNLLKNMNFPLHRSPAASWGLPVAIALLGLIMGCARAGEVDSAALQANSAVLGHAARPAYIERPQVIRSISQSGGDEIMALQLIRLAPANLAAAFRSPTFPRGRTGAPYPRSTYLTEIAYAVARTGVDEALIRSVIHAESSYRADAVSRAGAQGLMQLMPATARRFGVTNSVDPAQNILGGATYLRWLLNRYQGDTDLAVAAYNAGEGAVDKYGGIPPYQETQQYVSRVAMLLPQYQQIAR